MIIFKGDTREFHATITQSGVEVDPASFTEVQAYIFNYQTDDVIAQWSTATGDSTYGTITASGNTLIFCLSEAQTQDADTGQVIVQIAMKYTDPDAVDGYHRISKKGILGYIRNAKY